MLERVTDQLRDGRSTRWDPHRRERRAGHHQRRDRGDRGSTARTRSPARSRSWPASRAPTSTGTSTASRRSTSRWCGASRRQIGSLRSGPAWPPRAPPREIIGGGHRRVPGLDRGSTRTSTASSPSMPTPSTAPGSPTRDDAKARPPVELTGVLAGYMRALGLDDATPSASIIGVVGLVDATAAVVALGTRDTAGRTHRLADQAGLAAHRQRGARAAASNWIRTTHCPPRNRQAEVRQRRRSERTPRRSPRAGVQPGDGVDRRRG